MFLYRNLDAFEHEPPFDDKREKSMSTTEAMKRELAQKPTPEQREERRVAVPELPVKVETVLHAFSTLQSGEGWDRFFENVKGKGLLRDVVEYITRLPEDALAVLTPIQRAEMERFVTRAIDEGIGELAGRVASSVEKPSTGQERPMAA